MMKCFKSLMNLSIKFIDSIVPDLKNVSSSPNCEFIFNEIQKNG